VPDSANFSEKGIADFMRNSWTKFHPFYILNMCVSIPELPKRILATVKIRHGTPLRIYITCAKYQTEYQIKYVCKTYLTRK